MLLPHAIIAIDFGTEFTKVCYTIKNPPNDPRSGGVFDDTKIMYWPRKDLEPLEPILPTAVTRKQDASTAYGWQALQDGEDTAFKSTYLAFKLDLLSNKPHTFAIGETSCRFATDINQLLVDFFGYILKKVQDEIQSTLQNAHSVKWHQAHIDLVLTQPATGNEDSRLKYWSTLKDAIESAGFSAPTHRIIGDLEEPKAAARYVLQQPCDGETGHYQTGDTCILADAGGGTTDVCALYIDDIDTLAISPIGSHAMRGAIIGGMMLNKHLEKELSSYLQNRQHLLQDGITPIEASRVLSWGLDAIEAKIAIGNVMPDPPTSLIHRLLGTRAPMFKANSSNDEGSNQRTQQKDLEFDLSIMAPCMNHQVLGNDQIGSRGIWGLIGSAIDNVSVSGFIRKRLSDERVETEAGPLSFNTQAPDPVNVNHIILTGGFGSSLYVRTAIESAMHRDTRLAPGLQTGEAKYENLRTDRVRRTREPQLCVALGVLDAYRAQLLAEATTSKKAGFSLRRTWLSVLRR